MIRKTARGFSVFRALGFRFAGGVLLLALPCGSAFAAELKFTNFDESRAEFERLVKPFFAKHCNECHNEKKASGDLDLGSLDPDMKASTSGARWATLVENLTKGEMPPPKKKAAPDASSVAAVLRWANAEAKRANKHFTRRIASANGIP